MCNYYAHYHIIVACTKVYKVCKENQFKICDKWIRSVTTNWRNITFQNYGWGSIKEAFANDFGGTPVTACNRLLWQHPECNNGTNLKSNKECFYIFIYNLLPNILWYILVLAKMTWKTIFIFTSIPTINIYLRKL